MNNLVIGAGVGAGVGLLGVAVTKVTGDISVISLVPCSILSVFGAGLLYEDPIFEAIVNIIFYVVIGTIAAYIIGGGANE